MNRRMHEVLARRTAEHERGLTLVELVMAMALTTIILAVVGTVFVGALRTLSSVNSKAELSTSSDTAMRAIIEPLRAADLPAGQSPAAPAISEASPDAITAMVYLRDTARAASLAASINLISPGDVLAGWMDKTKLVPKKVRYSYSVNTSLCGGKSGVIQAITPPTFAYSNSGGNTSFFTWLPADTTQRCILRTETAPSATTIAAGTAGDRTMFRYFTANPASTTTYPSGCDTDSVESASVLSKIQSVSVTFYASDSTTSSPLQLTNRVCLVNVVKGSALP